MSRENIHFETAVLVSFALHVAVLGGWEQRAALTRVPVVGAIVKALTPAPKPVKVVQAKAEAPVEPVISFVEEPEPLPAGPPARPKQFIETDNTQVTGESPKNAEFYSDRATVAANPANPTGKTGDTPFLDGKETRMMSTDDVEIKRGPDGLPLPPQPATPASPAVPATPLMAGPKPASAPLLKPVPETKPPLAKAEPPQPKPEQPKPESKPSPALQKPKAEEGLKIQEEKKLAMLTPPQAPKTVPATPPPMPPEESKPAKPELSLRQPAPQPPSPGSPGSPAIDGGGGGGSEREIATRKSKLNTIGVDRFGVNAFNVENSPFGPYDKAIVRAVQSRWYALIEKNGLYERAGEVTIHFELLADGTVTNAVVKNTSAGEILALFCQKAIVESGPFAPWPEELKTYLGNEPREVDFTFYY